MKKKILNLIVLLTIFVPFVVNAQCNNTCNGVVGGGEGNRGNTTDESLTWCPSICWWGAGDGSPNNPLTGGVRVTIYSYKKGGKAIPLGSADIWTQKVHTLKFRMTSPTSSEDTLSRRKKCSFNFNPKYYNWDSYIGNEKVYQYTSDEYHGFSLTKSLFNGDVANWLYNNGSGWLQDNFFKYLLDGDYTKAGATFGISGANAKKLQTDYGNIYIVAELLMQVSYEGEMRSGTVSEVGPYVLYGSLMDRLRVTKTGQGKIGDLVSPIDKDSYIKEVSNNWSSSYGGPLDGDRAKESLCNNTHGLAIWYLPDCCPDCKQLTCKEACNGKTGAALQTCGKTFCDTVAKGDKDCLNECTFSCIGSSDCSTTDKEKCDNMTVTGGVITKTATCESNLSGKIDLGTTQTCKIIKNEDYNVNIAKLTCTESFTGDISSIKNKKVVFNKYGNANLNLTFKVNYKQSCELSYLKKTTNRSGKQTCLYEAKDYNDSELKAEIDDLKKLIKNIEKDRNGTCEIDKCKERANTAEDEKECETFCNNLKTNAETELSRLTNIEKYALKTGEFLKDEMLKEDNGSKEKTIDLSLKYIATGKTVSKENLSTATMKLVPVTCNEVKEIEWCDPETKQKVKVDKTMLKCDKSPNAIIVKGNEGTYEEEATYSIPSSYIATRTTKLTTDNIDYEGKIYHDYLYSDALVPNRVVSRGDATLKNGLVKCQNGQGVKKANGLCVEVPKAWQFDKMTEIQMREIAKGFIVNEGIHINISGMGECGQFNYDLTCDYTQTAYATCSEKCDNLAMGSEAFNKCVVENCGCDSLCGDNVACRTTYCPQSCELCVEEYNCACQDKCSIYTEGTSDYNKCIRENNCCESYCENKVKDGTNTYKNIQECKKAVCPDDGGKCKNKCSAYREGTDDFNECIKKNDCCETYCIDKVKDKTYETKEQCETAVCPNPPPPPTTTTDECETKCNESIACLCNCCTERCETKVKNGEYKTVDDCKKVECPECDCPKCDNDFIYRTVDVTTPFPDREPGNNWQEREKRIVDDKTATTANIPEYSITLTSEQLRDLKKIYKNEIVFKQPNASKTVKNKTNSKEYCSLILHGGDDKSKSIFESFHVNAKNACGS